MTSRRQTETLTFYFVLSAVMLIPVLADLYAPINQRSYIHAALACVAALMCWNGRYDVCANKYQFFATVLVRIGWGLHAIAQMKAARLLLQ